MKPKPNLPRRRATRLRGYDYRQPGAYFVTIGVQYRKCLFGEIIDGQMQSNEIGKIVIEYWNRIPQHFSSVELGECVVMPNHIHGIIVLGTVGARSPRPHTHPPQNRRGAVSAPASDPNRRGAVPAHTSDPNRRGVVSAPASDPNRRGVVSAPASDPNRRGAVSAPALGQIVAYFKYQSTKYINQRNNTPGTRIWQRNYYDHAIRDDADLQRIRQYIKNNPMQWELDQLHPNNPSKW